jgi:hypothetical protein
MLWPEGAKKKAPNGRTFQREVSGMFRISAVNEKHAEYFGPDLKGKCYLAETCVNESIILKYIVEK